MPVEQTVKMKRAVAGDPCDGFEGISFTRCLFQVPLDGPDYGVDRLIGRAEEGASGCGVFQKALRQRHGQEAKVEGKPTWIIRLGRLEDPFWAGTGEGSVREEGGVDASLLGADQTGSEMVPHEAEPEVFDGGFVSGVTVLVGLQGAKEDDCSGPDRHEVPGESIDRSSPDGHHDFGVGVGAGMVVNPPAAFGGNAGFPREGKSGCGEGPPLGMKERIAQDFGIHSVYR